MKKASLLTAAMFGLLLTTSAQTKPVKQLPPTITITITAREFLRLDSAVNTLAVQLDSKAFEAWFRGSFKPIYSVVEKQMIPISEPKKK